MILFSLIFAFVLGMKSEAAPCCAGSAALPAVITGDEAQNFSVSYAYGETLGDAPGAGRGLPVFRDTLSAKESRQILTLNYAKLIDQDRLQAGASAPLIFSRIENGGQRARSTNLGDVSFSLAYEALPEWEYTLWKPRVFTFSQITFPTGRSFYDSQNRLASDVGGLGQYQAAIGAIAIKRWSLFDANLLAKLSRIFAKDFKLGGPDDSSGEFRVGGSYALSASIGVGYSFAERYRFGVSLSPEYQSPAEFGQTGEAGMTSQKLVWNTAMTLTYLAGLNDSLVIGFSDQTWFGPAINTALIRTGSFAFTHRIER